jgi:hypothetical protein
LGRKYVFFVEVIKNSINLDSQTLVLFYLHTLRDSIKLGVQLLTIIKKAVIIHQIILIFYDLFDYWGFAIFNK